MSQFSFLSAIFVVTNLIGIAVSQGGTTGCDITHRFTQVGEGALLQSPGYSGSYGANLDCRYNITSPPGTQMTISCTDFYIEPSTNCEYDVLFLSASGDSTFKDQEFFCGQGPFTRTSKSNSLAIGFHSDESNPVSSQPYRFQCQITVQSSCTCGQQNYVVRNYPIQR
jgi:hypothetical protein